MKNQISKINEEIYSLLQRVDELENYNPNNDFDTREGKIVANIKVYEWLDEDDAIKICEKLNLDKTDVLEEFNENRLNSIYHHQCEDEVTFLKEQYEGNCDLIDYSKIFNVYHLTSIYSSKEEAIESRPSLSYYINTYFDRAKKFKTYNSYKKAIIKENKEEYEEHYRRSLFDFECWQYGRSGGWLSLFDESELNFEYEGIYWSEKDELEAAYNNDDNKAFNEVLENLDYKGSGNTYSLRKHKLGLIKELKEFISEVEEKISVAEYFVERIEDAKKYFKENLLYRLEEEIAAFVSEHKDTNVEIQISDDRVNTTLGVSVPLKEFVLTFNDVCPSIENLNQGEKLKIGRKVGNYYVEYAHKKDEDVVVKAGCHRFSFNQIKETINAYSN